MCTTGTLPNSEECLMKWIDDGMLTKEECLEVLESSEYLEVVIKDERARDVFRDSFKGTTIYNAFEQLIKEHFDNPPLKFEDFKIKTPYWDNKFKQWCFVIGKHSDEILETYIFRDPPIHRSNYFEEGRFYLREIKE
ncbi:hypothetical protein ACWG0P_13930 [Amedibacillus sp. YH-ame6]